jgi:hypothetical protein
MIDLWTPGWTHVVRSLVALRRGAVAFVVSVVTFGVIIARSHGRTPTHHGGWQEVPVSELGGAGVRRVAAMSSAGQRKAG